MESRKEIVKDGTGKAYLITSLRDFETSFDISFRTYSITNECGGYLTTYRISGVPIEWYKIFAAPLNEVKSLIENFGGKLIQRSTDNNVPEKFQYSSVKAEIKTL